jgi:uncharacterized protein (DUF302 family)
MQYSFNKILDMSFDDAINRVIDELKKEGFGILSDIDVQATIKKKLDVDFRKYRILGACNLPFAYKAIQVESRIGTMLPCNVIVQEIEQDKIEVSAIDPIASLQAIETPGLRDIAVQMRAKLKKVIDAL